MAYDHGPELQTPPYLPRTLSARLSDDGVTFGPPIPLPSSNTDLNPERLVFQSVPSPVQLADGPIAVYYVAAGRALSSIKSTDGGETWTEDPGWSLGAGFTVLAPESLNPLATSAAKQLEFDSSWNPIKSEFLANDDGIHYSMPSGVRLDTGYRIVNVKAIDGVNPRGVDLTAIPGTDDDSVSLIGLVVSPDEGVVDRQVLELAGVNRPHTTLIGDRLITTWDGPDSGGRLRIDRIAE